MGGRHKAGRSAGRRHVLAQLRGVLRRPGRRRPRSSTPPASWSLLGEAGAVAFLVAAVGAVLLGTGIVIGWREPLLGAALLLTPLLVRHVALGARHRWVGLPSAYAVLAATGYLVARFVDPSWPVTGTGFLGAAAGALLAGSTFAITSHVGGPTAPGVGTGAAGAADEPVRRVTYRIPAARRPDEDTDTLPGIHGDQPGEW